MRHAFNVAQPHGQQGLRPLQGLNLTLFVHAQHHGVLGGMQVQSHDIAQLLDEKRIGRQLEVPLSVRLQPEGLPDAMHGGLGQSRLTRDLADAPVRALLGSGLQGLRHQFRHALVADRAGATRAQLVVQPCHTRAQKSAAPFAHGRVRHPQLPRNLLVGHSTGTEQNDSRPVDHTGGQRTRTGQPFHLFSVLLGQDQGRFRSSHRHRHLHCAPEMPILGAILMPITYGTTH
jgi:hypothetical protein